MNLIDRLIEDVNNPTPESIIDNTINEAKNFISLGFLFIILWIILLIVDFVFVGIKGDEGAGFGVFLFGIGLSVLSEIIGVWLLYRKSRYIKKIQDGNPTLKRLQTVAMVLIFSPLLFTVCVVIIFSLFNI